MLALVPAKPRQTPAGRRVNSCSAFSPKPYFTAPKVSCERDVRRRVCPRQIRIHRVAIQPHMRMVHIAQHPHHSLASGIHQPAKQRLPQLELPVLPTRPPQVPVQVDSVGHRRHQRQRIPRRPVLVVILGDRAVGVAARVGRVVPRAVVVHRPVHELQMAVRANRVDIEKSPAASSCRRETPAAAPAPGRKRKRRPLDVHHLVGEADRLVHLHPRHIRHRPQVRIAHHIQIRKPASPSASLTPRPPADSTSKITSVSVPRSRVATPRPERAFPAAKSYTRPGSAGCSSPRTASETAHAPER